MARFQVTFRYFCLPDSEPLVFWQDSTTPHYACIQALLFQGSLQSCRLNRHTSCVRFNPSLTPLWREHHGQHAPFHLRPLFDGGQFVEVALNPLQQLVAQFLVRHLASAKPQSDLGPVTFFQELAKIPEFYLVVRRVCTRPELHLFNMDLLLIPFRRVRLLALFKNELAVIHDPANRRFCFRGDLDKIQLGFMCLDQRISQLDNPDLFTVLVNKTDFPVRDLVIASDRIFRFSVVLPS
jgi:hypothetical protein